MQIDEALLKKVDNLYKPTIKNYSIFHPKLLILFSAPPSSGKSTIAKQIEQHFKAIRLENDSIRLIAGQLNPDSDLAWKSELSYKYMAYLWFNLVNSCPNGLWVIDSTIDRHHEKVFEFARNHNFPKIVIAINIPEELRRKWILKAGNRPWASAAEYIDTMALRKSQQNNFLALYNPDLVIRPDYKIKEVLDIIQTKLNKLQNN